MDICDVSVIHCVTSSVFFSRFSSMTHRPAVERYFPVSVSAPIPLPDRPSSGTTFTRAVKPIRIPCTEHVRCCTELNGVRDQPKMTSRKILSIYFNSPFHDFFYKVLAYVVPKYLFPSTLIAGRYLMKTNK